MKPILELGSNGKLKVETKNNVPIALVTRYNNNDCWNIALALALNLTYEDVRKVLKPYINSNGGMYHRFVRKLLLSDGYEPVDTTFKTAKSFIDDTKYTNYEYVISTTGHVVYGRYGVIYDSFKSDLKKIKCVYKRKISKKRISKYDFLTKEVIKSI